MAVELAKLKLSFTSWYCRKGHTGKRVSSRVWSAGEIQCRVSTYLESDQGKGQTGVGVEEEQHGQIEALDQAGIGACRACIEIGEASVGGFLVVGAEELVVDAIPIGIDLIDALAADLEFDVGDELFCGEIGCGGGPLLEGDLEEHGIDEIAIPGNGAGHALSVVHTAVESLLDGFEGKLGVTAVHHLEESDGGRTCEIDILHRKRRGEIFQGPVGERGMRSRVARPTFSSSPERRRPQVALIHLPCYDRRYHEARK
jgi:hypothetical protein